MVNVEVGESAVECGEEFFRVIDRVGFVDGYKRAITPNYSCVSSPLTTGEELCDTHDEGSI